MAVDAAGNLYITEFSGNRVRKVDTSGTITTFAGGHLLLNGNGDGGGVSRAACRLLLQRQPHGRDHRVERRAP